MAINIRRLLLLNPYYKGVKVKRMAATVELSHGWPVLARTSQCSATIPFQIYYSSIGERGKVVLPPYVKKKYNYGIHVVQI